MGQHAALQPAGDPQVESDAIRKAADLDAGVEALLGQFAAALDEDASLDAETKEFLKHQFGAALEDTTPAASALEQLGNRTLWVDAVQALQDSGALAEREANDLVRQLEGALAPLQRRESRLALEFSRRMQSEGEEQALSWFREQLQRGESAEADAASSTGIRAPDLAPQLRTDMTQSRSRRLRGPPKPR
ncbi:hypothetical protein LDO32_11685 [Luteimonas sp. Y-2-2-4F]|nr:hypothetical protein [Luteimonas sp. Y-2-2-4F]MCD9032386.1 hypothetical protein [Luteimonas sp. Y-2-2-4F]